MNSLKYIKKHILLNILKTTKVMGNESPKVLWSLKFKEKLGSEKNRERASKITGNYFRGKEMSEES